MLSMQRRSASRKPGSLYKKCLRARCRAVQQSTCKRLWTPELQIEVEMTICLIWFVFRLRQLLRIRLQNLLEREYENTSVRQCDQHLIAVKRVGLLDRKGRFHGESMNFRGGGSSVR